MVLIVPLIEEVTTRLKPFDIFSLYKDEKDLIFLDSANESSIYSKYSFIGLHPFKTVKLHNDICYLDNEIICEDVFNLLNSILKKYECSNSTFFPFIAGGMGYFSYDLCYTLEDLPNSSSKNVDIPDCYFVFYDNIIVYDHKNEKTYISSLGILEDKETSIKKIKAKIASNSKITYKKFLTKNLSFKSNFTKSSYISAIKKIIDYIENGDIYITNMTHTYKCKLNRDSYSIYKILRKINPAPFAAYLKFDGFNILSSSPERFIKINNRNVETRPIKGTRPRGKNLFQDLINRFRLKNSEKDKSELLMIVDLERNDLSKVCKPNSVKVTELFKIEKYPTVFHLVSTIIGVLDDNKTAVDCIKACFPGGSITGAPKVRAMEIIEELEPVKRNIYTGCIGYLGFDGNCDTNIVIRTILHKDNVAYIGVGGGITWESNPEDEYYETLDKAKALFNSLKTCEIGDDESE